MLERTVDRHQARLNRRGNGDEVLQPGTLRGVIQHHVELRSKDQYADTGEHSMDDRRRYRAKHLPHAEQPGRNLHNARKKNNDSQCGYSKLLHQLPHHDRQSRGWSADL